MKIEWFDWVIEVRKSRVVVVEPVVEPVKDNPQPYATYTTVYPDGTAYCAYWSRASRAWCHALYDYEMPHPSYWL